MFDKSAQFYDLIYSFKDYKSEAETIIQLITEKHPACKTVLDVACGTAEHHKYLKDNYSLDGIDLNEEFIESAKKKNPDGNYFVADMTDFSLDKKYDVILCLFSSIGYVKTLQNIIKTLNCFKKHLDKSGLLIVEPWFKPDEFVDGRIFMQIYDGSEIKICRMSKSSIQDNTSIINFYYQVLEKDGTLSNFSENHELGLFTVDEMKSAFAETGFTVDYEEKGLMGRGLYFGT